MTPGLEVLGVYVGGKLFELLKELLLHAVELITKIESTVFRVWDNYSHVLNTGQGQTVDNFLWYIVGTMNTKNGQMILFVGPTCVGKTTIIEALRGIIPNTGVIISTTTRPIRPNEIDGVDYEFTTAADFINRKEAGEVFEAVERPTGYYGSSRLQVHSLLEKHPIVFGALDVEGCRIVKSMEPNSLVIFLSPGDIGDLHKRLLLRGAGEEEIGKRLHVAEEEMLSRSEFDDEIVNIDGKFNETIAAALTIFKKHGVMPLDTNIA